MTSTPAIYGNLFVYNILSKRTKARVIETYFSHTNIEKCKNAQTAVISVFNNSYDAPMITMRRFHPKVLDEVSIELDKFDFQTWHSFCFVFDTQHQFPYPGGYTNLTNRAYIDGKLVSSG